MKSDKSIWRSYYSSGIRGKILKKLKLGKLYRAKYNKKKVVLSQDEAQHEIAMLIQNGQPAMIARFGSNEACATAEAIGIRLGAHKCFREKTLFYLNRNAGVFPYGADMAMRFADVLIESAKQVDILGAWSSFMQNYLIDEVCSSDMKTTPLAYLEPFFSPNPWTAALKGKKVLVIHPFKETIESQYKKRELLFDNPDVLPEFDLTVIKAVQTIAYEKDERFADWIEALNYMHDEAMKVDFDVAIIGCGAYGMPLAAKIKQSGKIAIHLGGATQLLFGIKGARWENDPRFDELFKNENWVRPMSNETPQNAKTIEGACYW